jgi:hypothetical protein
MHRRYETAYHRSVGDTDPEAIDEAPPATRLVREVGGVQRHPRIVLCIVLATVMAMAASVVLALLVRL